MFLLPLTVGLLLVSCKKETVAPQQQTLQQSADGKKPSIVTEKVAGIQTMTFNTSPLYYWGQIFNNVNVSGNSKIIITLTNTGTSHADAYIRTTGTYSSWISVPLIPPGTSHTYHYTISGWSGNVFVEVYPSGSGHAKGSITIQSL